CFGPRNARLNAVAHLVEAFSSALAGEELGVPLVDVGGDQRCRLRIGAGDDHTGSATDIGCQACGLQCADVLAGGNQDFAAQVSALLLGGQLVFPVHACSAGGDHLLHQLVGVQRAAESCFGICDDRDHPVLDGADALQVLDLV